MQGLQTNSSLTHLSFKGSGIGDKGAEGIGENSHFRQYHILVYTPYRKQLKEAETEV